MKRTQLLKLSVLAMSVAFLAGCMCPAAKTVAPEAVEATKPAPVSDNSERLKRMEEAYGSK